MANNNKNYNNKAWELKKLPLASLLASVKLEGEAGEYAGFIFMVERWLAAEQAANKDFCVTYKLPKSDLTDDIVFAAGDSGDDKRAKANAAVDCLASSLLLNGYLRLDTIARVHNITGGLSTPPLRDVVDDWRLLATMWDQLDDNVKLVAKAAAYAVLLTTTGSVSFSLTLKKALSLASAGKTVEMNRYLGNLTGNNLQGEYVGLIDNALSIAKEARNGNVNVSTPQQPKTPKAGKDIASQLEAKTEARVNEILTAVEPPVVNYTPAEHVRPEPPRIELPRIEVAPIKIPDVTINIQETRSSSGSSGGSGGGGKSSDGWTTAGEIIGGMIVVGAVGALGYWAYNKIFGDSSDEIELAEFGNGIDL